MTPSEPQPPSIFGSVRRLSVLVPQFLRDLKELLRGYADLLRAELVASGKALGFGLVFSILALGLTLLASIFLLTAAVFGLSETGLPLWACFLIMGVAIMLLVAGLALAAKRKFTKVTLPNRTLAVLDELGKQPPTA